MRLDRRGAPFRFAPLLLMASVPSHAALWSVDNAAEARLDMNDNPPLAARPSGTVFTQALSNRLSSARQTENSTTRFDATFTGLRESDDSDRQRIDGRLAMAQTWSAERDLFSTTLQMRQDTTFDNIAAGTDVVLGRGQRRSADVSAAWTHALDELSTLGLVASASRTSYGSDLPAAIDFRNVSLAATGALRLTELDSVRGQLGVSDFRTLPSGANQTRSVDFSVGYSHAIDERSSVSLGVGQYRTRRTTLVPVAVCPLPIDFCTSGLVLPILVGRAVNDTGRSLQYSGSYAWRIDELSQFSASLSRQQAPSGSGSIVLTDGLSVAASRPLSPTLDANLGYSRTRSKYGTGDESVTPTVSNFSLSFTKALAENVSVGFSFQRLEAKDGRSGLSARSHGISVTLKYDGPKMDFAH